MTNIKLDSQVMSNIKNENLIAMLNKVIDDELDKDASQVNTSLIEECIDAILQIEQDEDSSFRVLVPLMSSDDFLRSIMPRDNISAWKRLNVFARVAVVAAIVTTGTFSVNAAVRSITDYDFLKEFGNKISVLLDSRQDDEIIEKAGEDTKGKDTSSPQVTTHQSNDDTPDDENAVTPSNVDKAVSQTMGANNNDRMEESTTHPTTRNIAVYTTTERAEADDGTTNQNTTQPTIPAEHIETTVPTGDDPFDESKHMVGLYVNSSNMKTAYIYGESLNYDGLVLKKMYSDGTLENLSYTDCKRTTNLDTSKVGDYVVKLEYQNVTAHISVTVRPNEETRYSEVCSNDEYDYFLVSKGAIVTKYKGDSKNIVLDSIDGHSVYSIEQNVYKNSDLISFSSTTCQRIMDSAFENCSSLRSATIPNCSFIGARAFRHTGIEKMNIPSSVTEINNYTFDGCESLTDVKLGGNVTRIGKFAFNECFALENVTGTGKVKRVEDFAFYDNKLMELDTTLNNLTYAGEYAFAYCNSAVLDTIKNMSYIGDGAFMYCFNISTVHIGGNIDVVGAESFRGTRITSLTLDEGIRSIGNYAFMSTQIKELVLPNSIRTIGTYAFYTNKITSVKGAHNAEKVESMAFYPNRRMTMYVLDKSTMYYYAKNNGIPYTIVKNNSVIETPEEEV